MSACVYNLYSRLVHSYESLLPIFTIKTELMMQFLWSLLFLLCWNVKKSTSRFSVYWNVPTESCHKYGLNFSELRKLGLVQNKGDRFRGEEITILYDPGMFPAILGQADRNGGVPQEGNLTRHLLLFQKQLTMVIPDPTFKGVGIIDFEQWRPIWRENWGSLDVYRKRSIEIERKIHPFWPNTRIEATATARFEKAGFFFIEETLELARKVRPRGIWGYYAFPYCFNFTPKNPYKDCTKQVIKDNDRSSWMYETGTALFPSIYLREKDLNADKRIKMIAGRLTEAERVASRQRKWKIRVLPYLAVKYQDTFNFLTKVDMSNGIKTSRKLGTAGIILWGSSKDTNTQKKCEQLLKYVTNVIGPIIKNM